jgi:chromosome transmission fidelity protein 4
MLGVIECTDQEAHQIINVEFHDQSQSNRRGYHFNDTFRYTMASLGPRGAVYACPPEKDAGSGSTANMAQIHYRPYETWASSAEWTISLNEGEVPVAVCAGGAPLKRVKDDEGDVLLEDDEDPEERAFREGPKDAGGAGYVIAALNTGDIYFWLGTGILSYIWRIGGEVVAMDAGSEWLFVIHRDGGTSLDGAYVRP